MSSIFLIFLIYFLRHSWTRFDSAMDMHLDAGIFHRGRRGRRLNLTCDFLLSLALVLLLLLLLLHSILFLTHSRSSVCLIPFFQSSFHFVAHSDFTTTNQQQNFLVFSFFFLSNCWPSNTLQFLHYIKVCVNACVRVCVIHWRESSVYSNDKHKRK